jgi:hypothetical protein
MHVRAILVLCRASTSPTAVRIQGWAPIVWQSSWLVLDDVLDLLQDLGGQLWDNLKGLHILQDWKRLVRRRRSARWRYTHVDQGGTRPLPWCSCSDHGLATPGRAAQRCSQGRLQRVRQVPSLWLSEPSERGCSSRSDRRSESLVARFHHTCRSADPQQVQQTPMIGYNSYLGILEDTYRSAHTILLVQGTISPR